MRYSDCSHLLASGVPLPSSRPFRGVRPTGPEELLAEPIEAGDLTAKLLIIDARIRGVKLESARVLFLTIDDNHVPAHLQHPYAVTAALLALALKDDNIRCRARLAFGRMPVAAVEANEGVQSLMVALNAEDWAEG